MSGWANFWSWQGNREGPERIAGDRSARQASRVMGTKPVGEEGGVRAVRWGTAVDEPMVARLMELNGVPRWVAFEERFIVVEGAGGKLLAAMRYRTESDRLIPGLPVVDPWAGESTMVGALYGGAVELARCAGLAEVVARPAGPAKEAQIGYLRGAGWRRGLLSDAVQIPSVRELPQGGWRRLAALFGTAAVPFSRAFRS